MWIFRSEQKAKCYAFLVRCCHVQMKGKDGRSHSVTLQASSLFDAADRGIHQWARLWWYDPTAPLTVQCGEDRWLVSQDRVRVWRGGRHRTDQQLR